MRHACYPGRAAFLQFSSSSAAYPKYNVLQALGVPLSDRFPRQLANWSHYCGNERCRTHSMLLLRPRKTPEANRLSILLGCMLLLVLQAATPQARAVTLSAAVKFLGRHLAPLRSNPFLQSSARPCRIGVANCFIPGKATLEATPVSTFEPRTVAGNEYRIVFLELRTLHRGPLAHHWLETETSAGKVTVGYGPATLPFIDAGQVSLQDEWGNIERISGMYPVPPLGLPPLNYRYARSPGEGRPIGKPIALTMPQAESLVQHIRRKKFVGPYIPIFHDCRTFVCATRSAAQGRSSLPCYLLFKGYW
jgi:hypothetical protein